jgi:ferredoxin-NADP reductase
MPQRFIRYKIAFRQFKAHNVLNLVFVPEDKKNKLAPFLAGQFVMIHLLDTQGNEVRTKPYSLYNPIADGSIAIGFKIEGAFTQNLSVLCRGDCIGVSGPFGVFTLDKKSNADIIMLAGGIGIVPLLSMIQFAVLKQLPNAITLFYCNHDARDIAYYDELQLLKAHHTLFTPHFLVSAPPPAPQKDVLQGKISWKFMREKVTPNESTLFYICGSERFMEHTLGFLLKNGVSKKCIKKEVFT